jgi:hypothetical protein
MGVQACSAIPAIALVIFRSIRAVTENRTPLRRQAAMAAPL